jgi:putative aldouronate transport system permease protein
MPGLKTRNICNEKRGNTFCRRLLRDIILNKYAYLLVLPALLYYILFHYIPLYGAQIAFKTFNFRQGILGSPWVGLRNFTDFFSSYYFERLIINTLMLSCSNILFGFPAPIILALLINELHNGIFKRVVQSVTYLPHFISMVVVCSFILDFTSRNGVINNILSILGFEVIPFMSRPEWFRPIYVVTDIWQEVGWGSIIYLAALSGIDVELYEACRVDGGGRFRQMFAVTLPGIAPTIIVMLILRMGRIMNVGLEKVLLLYNPGIYETADIISTFVYRKGLIELDYSYSAAVGLFNSVVNFCLLLIVNKISKKKSETSLF